MVEAYVIGGLRTPIGKYGGQLAGVRADDLASHVLQGVVERFALDPEAIDEVVLGAANQAGEDNRNVARMATLLAGLPVSVPAYTVNRLCASGLTAVIAAADSIRSGNVDLVIAGGVESMTRAPWVMAKPERAWRGPGEIAETSLGWRFVNPRMPGLDDGFATVPMGETAELVAELDGITREDSDEFALSSHERALSARARLGSEIIPIVTAQGRVEEDEGPRSDASSETLAGLRTVFRPGGIVTAGSSSPLSDGAAAVVLASASAVKRHSLTPQARVVGSASAGVRPSLMGLGPVESTRQALARARWRTEDLDAIELNEAFAAQALACIRRLNIADDRVNADGGAIALGHPLGMSGARLVLSLTRRLQRDCGPRSKGLATLCVGVGQGVSLLIEAC